jgi:hypothetical protein
MIDGELYLTLEGPVEKVPLQAVQKLVPYRIRDVRMQGPEITKS